MNQGGGQKTEAKKKEKKTRKLKIIFRQELGRDWGLASLLRHVYMVPDRGQSNDTYTQ